VANRHQRRAAVARNRPAHPAGIFRTCKPADLARAIAAVEQTGQTGLAELLREVRTGTFALVAVETRNAIVRPEDLQACVLPAVTLIGDDDYASTGPAGWRGAAAVAAWARCAVIHAAGATAETYKEAIRGARATVGRR